MQGPGSVKEDGTNGKPPVVDGTLEEYEEAVPDAEYKLFSRLETCSSNWEWRFKRTSIRMSLCRSTPLRMFASVMQDMMIRAPTMKPCAHASRTRPFGFVGFVTGGPRLARETPSSTRDRIGLISATGVTMAMTRNLAP
jgi:hypothetical protein